MENERITIEYFETNVRPVFGGKRIEAVYIMTHVKYGRVNKYKVTCGISGIQVHDIELVVTSAEFWGDMETESNDETLVEFAAMQLFEDNL